MVTTFHASYIVMQRYRIEDNIVWTYRLYFKLYKAMLSLVKSRVDQAIISICQSRPSQPRPSNLRVNCSVFPPNPLTFTITPYSPKPRG